MDTVINRLPPLNGPVLVTGGTGKTGHRVAARLLDRGLEVRIGSRAAHPSFDWSRPQDWQAALSGIKAVYIAYVPDLAMPGATDTIRAFCETAKGLGVERAVLLSGRGEPEAQKCERIVAESGLSWTVVRASWFNQNFSEGAFLEMVLSGQIALPVGAIPEPFVDVDDIADVAVAALTENGHAGEVYEVTGPRLLTFQEIADVVSLACGRDIKLVTVPHEAFLDGVAASGAPKDVVWILDYLFSTILDGRNASVADGVQRALGRAPKDFTAYARDVAATGLWAVPA